MNTKTSSLPSAMSVGAASMSISKPRRFARKLPKRSIWPTWALLSVQSAILVGFVALWEIAATWGWLDAFFWSQPSAIAHTMGIFFTQGNAFVHIAYTFRSTIMAMIMQPYITCLESIPKLALAPLIILVFGMGLASKVAIATALTLVVSTLTAYSGVQAVDRDQEKLFYSLGASRWQVFTKLVAPSCIPWVISILRVNIGLALTGSIVGEFVASQHGLGRTILYAGQTYEIALVWVAVLVLSALSILMYLGVSWLERVLRKGTLH